MLQRRVLGTYTVYVATLPGFDLNKLETSSSASSVRGCFSDLLPDMLKPAFPAKSDLPPTFLGGFFVAKNKGRLPKITFGVFLFFSFAAKSLICCQKLDLLQVSAYLAANH